MQHFDRSKLTVSMWTVRYSQWKRTESLLCSFLFLCSLATMITIDTSHYNVILFDTTLDKFFSTSDPNTLRCTYISVHITTYHQISSDWISRGIADKNLELNWISSTHSWLSLTRSCHINYCICVFCVLLTIDSIQLNN